MGGLPCAGYAATKIERCAEKRDNGYWKCDDWADELYYKTCGWQPCKFFCHALIWIAKSVGKAYYGIAHKVAVIWRLSGIPMCVLYAWSFSITRLFGKVLGFDILAPTHPTSPFGPAVAYGRYIDERGEETSRPVIMCWTETGDPKTGSSGLRLRYEQLRHYSSPFHNMLPQFGIKVVNGEVSHRGPALAFYNNTFFLAWTEKKSEHRLSVMQSSNGGDTWRKKVTLDASSTSAPALAVFRNRVYLAWRTKPREGSYLKIMSSADGVRWENETKLAARAESGPALASLGSLLFIAWNDKDNHRLNLKSSKDGISFEHQVALQETTDARPGLGEYGNQLYLAWKGHNGVIRIRRSKDGHEWGKDLVGLLPQRPSNTGEPALASASKGLIIGWANPNLHIAGRR